MGNIVNDIVDNIDIKPNKTKLYLKWGASIAGTLIILAFAFGQFQTSFFNRMDKLEEKLSKNTELIKSVKTDMSNEFINVNKRIDKGYSDGLDALQSYQEFNKKQLILVLDYGQTNKGLLKEMLEINMQEKARSIEDQINQSRTESVVTPTRETGVREVDERPISSEYYGKSHFVEVATNDTIFQITGATKEYIENIDKNKYDVGAMTESAKYPGRYDVAYRNKD